MVLWQRRSPFLRSRRTDTRELRRLREKLENLTRATEQWLTLLREMEQSGESSAAQYDRYYHAYLQARRQQKDIELALFNHRQGLID